LVPIDPRLEGRAARRLKVAISALTYRRPEPLRQLLASISALQRPQACELFLIIVDNDPEASATDLVQRTPTSWPVHYFHEPRRGIPVARNRALREARALGIDLLCFIDDDEVPDTAWLDCLVSKWRASDANLIGGPVEVLPAPHGASVWQRFVNAGLAERMRRKNRRTNEAAMKGRRFTVVTNNWLGELPFFAERDLTFDETLLVTGGSDTMFHAHAKRGGAVTAWAADAVVREAMPLDRLTLRYQLRRGAMQSMQNFRLASPRITGRVVGEVAVMAPVRLLSGLLLFVLPIYGVASPVIAVRSIGWAIGRVAALFGARSVLYS
jgi:glycosyltransferase involved in cell wall biosynthesis